MDATKMWPARIVGRRRLGLRPTAGSAKRQKTHIERHERDAEADDAVEEATNRDNPDDGSTHADIVPAATACAITYALSFAGLGNVLIDKDLVPVRIVQ